MLVFSQSVQMLGILEQFMTRKGYEYRYAVDMVANPDQGAEWESSTSQTRGSCERVQQLPEHLCVLNLHQVHIAVVTGVYNRRTGGLGLNLTSANKGTCYSST